MYSKSIFVFCLIFFSNYAADYRIPPSGVCLGIDPQTEKIVFQFSEGFRVGFFGALQPGLPNFPIIPPSSLQPVIPGAVSSLAPQPLFSTLFSPFLSLTLEQQLLQNELYQERLRMHKLVILQQYQQGQQQQQQIVGQGQLLDKDSNTSNSNKRKRKKKQTPKKVSNEKKEIVSSEDIQIIETPDIQIIEKPEKSSESHSAEIQVGEQELEGQKRKSSSQLVLINRVSDSALTEKKIAILCGPQPSSDLFKPEAPKKAPKKTAAKPIEKDGSNIPYNQTRNVVNAVEPESVDILGDESLTAVSTVELIGFPLEPNPTVDFSTSFNDGSTVESLEGFELDLEWFKEFIESDEQHKVAHEEKEKKDQQQILAVLWLVGAYKKIGEMASFYQILSPEQQKQFDFATTLQSSSLQSSSGKSLDERVRIVFANAKGFPEAIQTVKQDPQFNELYDSLLTGKHDGRRYSFFPLVQSAFHIFSSKMVTPSSNIVLHMPLVGQIEEGQQPFVQDYVSMLQTVFDGFTKTRVTDFSFLTPKGFINLARFLALVDSAHFHKDVWLTMKRDFSVLARQSGPLSMVVDSQSEKLSLSSPLGFFVTSAFKKLKSYSNPVEQTHTFSRVLNQGRFLLIDLLGNHLSKKIESKQGFSDQDQHHAENFKTVIQTLFEQHALDSHDELTVSCIQRLHSLCLDYEQVQIKIFPTKNIADLIHQKARSVVMTINVLREDGDAKAELLTEALSYFESRAHKPCYQ